MSRVIGWLAALLRPLLESVAFMRGAEVTKRYGPAQKGTPRSVIRLMY